MSKSEAKMELHEKTAAAEALPITDEERRWCDMALSALPAEQAKRFNEIPLDVCEPEQKFPERLPQRQDALRAGSAHLPAIAARCAETHPCMMGRCSAWCVASHGKRTARQQQRRCVHVCLIQAHAHFRAGHIEGANACHPGCPPATPPRGRGRRIERQALR
jgi:hypothetical protein